MHHRRASSVLSALLVVAHTVSATSLFPRAHLHTELASSHIAVEKRIDSAHVNPRILKSVSNDHNSVKHAPAIERRDSDSERSIFAMVHLSRYFRDLWRPRRNRCCPNYEKHSFLFWDRINFFFGSNPYFCYFYFFLAHLPRYSRDLRYPRRNCCCPDCKKYTFLFWN